MNIVGITSCIAGLAHTPMAAKALEKAGDKLGHNVKIEQQGAMGIVNELKNQDIENAEVVIIAADKVIDGEDRFKNKTVVKVNIGHCVSNAEAVIKKIVSAVEERKNKN
ncbi:MAG: PTS fructose transporter subunit IIB [Fusobacteriaceae bacterium]|jgi:PTS system fructose-specific IIB component|nr:PTS fructose transporter subunit IIB [Fusobacteriaceae bacterium]MBN2837344.1 PTS fructose transporter subunit IIB [Fusobacteriaceae bacterium]